MQERYKLEMELKNYPDVVTTKEHDYAGRYL